MTGYESKRAAAQDRMLDDDDTQVYQDHDDALTIAYQSGFYDGKKAAQPAQEPVAWMYQEYRDGWRDEIQFIQPPNDPIYFRNIVPVYDTTPPQRPWVDLTEDEIVQIGVATGLERAAVEMISYKLKEKNNAA